MLFFAKTIILTTLPPPPTHLAVLTIKQWEVTTAGEFSESNLSPPSKRKFFVFWFCVQIYQELLQKEQFLGQGDSGYRHALKIELSKSLKSNTESYSKQANFRATGQNCNLQELICTKIHQHQTIAVTL